VSIQQKEKGFTIIEVVLVLAIAGLIFMMVFIALPALQRSQRDTQRKNDLSRVHTAITNYSSSNKGNLPVPTAAGYADFESKYLLVNGDTFIDPLGSTSTQSSATAYVFTVNSNPLQGVFDDTTQNIIYVSPGYVCSQTSNFDVTYKGTRSVAFRMYLEGGGTDCRSN
jgi:prepilin-type N-terminal cleavage/methylation domain-containing protein